ncbi:MAG: PqqD family protein [Prevotellaceae bacterium]|nr:PqqD family protein [Prevotellaceae bacterium]
MRQKKGFELRQVCGENVLMAEGLETIDFGKLVNFNETAAFLWKEAAKQGDFTAESLAEALCQEYDIDSATAVGDTKSLIDSWLEAGIIE